MQVKWKDSLTHENVLKQTKLLPSWCLKWSKGKVVTIVLLIITVSLILIFNFYQPGGPQNVVKCVGNGCATTSVDAYRHERIRYHGTKRRLPQCLIIGARKAGTRALLQILNIHPLIMTAGHEQHFFDDDDNYVLGLDYYRKQMPFSFPGQITLEKTPSYLHTDEVPERVKQMNSSIKILVILRDPVERAVSDYVQIKEKQDAAGRNYGTFESKVYNYETEEVNESSPLLHRSIYVRHIQNWLRYFPIEQFHFVDGYKIVKNPHKEIKAVETFLGLPHRINEENLVYNSTKGFYCFRNQSLNGGLKSAKCLTSSKGRTHPDVDPEVIQALRQYFVEFNEKLFRVIHRRFNWPKK